MYSVKIIADSINPTGNRIITFEATYPRFVHAELMTHRLFSRNSASSRALPTSKLLDQIENNPVMPKWWGANQSGMQAREELTGWKLEMCKKLWLLARDGAVWAAKCLHAMDLHKQIANRVLEPWMFITVIVTATEYDNWFYLRDSEFAQPEIAWVAREMKKVMAESDPQPMGEGMWHTPYIDQRPESPLFIDLLELAKAINLPIPEGANNFMRSWPFEAQELIGEAVVKIATARCARVSYLTHDGQRDYIKDIELHDKCRDNGHWSAFEHCAQALGEEKWSGNFLGWQQYRKTFHNEHHGKKMS